jgi:5-methyltetrahydrofolate--homocysteine methyltransferase
VREVLDELGIDLPIMISGTITDASGRTLSGQTTEAFWNSIRHASPPWSGSIARSAANSCAPTSRSSRASPTPTSAPIRMPDCRTPSANTTNPRRRPPPSCANSRERLSQHGRRLLRHDARAHPRALRARSGVAPRRAARSRRLPLSGLEPLTIDARSLFVNVGERTNVTGSAKFRKLIEAGDYGAAVDIARQQVANGAQIIDVNMDEGMLDSQAAMVRFLNLIAGEPDIARVPVMIDSSKWSVIEAG